MNPTLLGVQIAERLADRIAHVPGIEGAPDATQPSNLLRMLNRLVEKAEKEEWPDTKIHRWLGYVMGCLTAHGITTESCLREIVGDSKKYFEEQEDDDLKAHNDPDSMFRLDIGGEG